MVFIHVGMIVWFVRCVKMAKWKKGKVFTKNGRKVRYIYKNGSKRNKRLVSAKRKRSYRGRRY